MIEHSASWPGPRVLWKCIEFVQDAIGGLALLELAGVNSGQPPQVYDWGGGSDTVCQLDRQPAAVPDRCFGPTSGPNWSDWSVTPSGWVARSTGVNGYTVRDGDVEGWTYSSAFGTPPPATRFEQICSAPVASVAATHARAAPTVAPATPAPAAPATSSASADLATATPSASTMPRAGLAATGPPAPPPKPPAAVPWLLFGAAATLLAGLGAINLLRRGP